MLFWRRSTLPLDDATRAWVASRMAWLVEQFGWERLRGSPVVLPNEAFFPDAYDGGPRGARAMLDRVCRYMDVNSARVELRLYSERNTLGHSFAFHPVTWSGAAGIYQEENGRALVWLEQANLADPLATAATIAHELAHVRLLGERRISPDEDDHELLTDLATVYFGLGVITANASVRERHWRSQGWEGWTMSRHGYLTAPVYGYALALFAAWRQEASPAWGKSLRPDVRVPFRQTHPVLAKNVGATLPASVSRSAPLSPLLRELASRGHKEKAEPSALPPEPTRAQSEGADPSDDHADVHGSADLHFTRGLHFADEGRHVDAVSAFTEALRYDPADGEIYQHRAASLVELHRYAEALTDADRALKYDPDDWHARRTRGLVLLRQGDLRGAILEFNRLIHDRGFDLLAYYHRGEAWARLGEYRKAVNDFTLLIRHSPDWREPLVARSLCYEILGKPREAERDRQEAERLQGR